MKEFVEFKIQTRPFQPEILSGLLWNLELDGLNENEESISIFAEKSSEIEQKLNNLLKSAIENELIDYFEITKNNVENKNWNEEWEKNLNVIEISDKIVIKPTFREYENPQNKIVINLDPKMSFGTGEHETTKMMIRAIEKHVSKGDFVLDAGAGTAILAIAALKLGASKAIAFDNDEWCKINGDENKNLNQISEELEIILGEIADVQQTNFDLILANINTHILIEIKKQLAEKLKFGGKMILSGLLNADNSLITEHFQSEKLQKIDEDSENEWSLLVFQKE